MSPASPNPTARTEPNKEKTINILTWNLNGLRDEKIRLIDDLNKTHNISINLLQEIHNIKRARKKLENNTQKKVYADMQEEKYYSNAILAREEQAEITLC
jgi:exonuclease III